MRKHALRAMLALTTTAALTTGLTTAPANAAGSDVTPQAAKAASWLAGQLDEGLVRSSYESDGEWFSYTDYGLTLDFFYAFDALDVRQAARQRILDAIEGEVNGYVAPYGTTYAGAVGKLLSAVQAHGIDPSTYGDGDLTSRLEALVHTADDSELGRAEDAPSDDESDTSNTIGQSFVARALTHADSALADEAVTFLLKQQCSEGYFRVYMDSSDHTCDGGTDAESGPSIDATAAAVLALLAVKELGVAGVDTAALDTALRDAARWLVGEQADNGSFEDGGVPNTNSTGLAAQALAGLDRERAAKRAASWTGALRVTKQLAERTAFKRRDVGAVAFSRAALREGKAEGITRGVRYQWRRSTAQSAGALDILSP